MNMKIFGKPILSLILCSTLVFCFLIPGAYAAEETTEGVVIDYGNDEERNSRIGGSGTDLNIDSDSDVRKQPDPVQLQPSFSGNNINSGSSLGSIDGGGLTAVNYDETVRYGLYIGGIEVDSENSSTGIWDFDANTSTLTLKGGKIEERLFCSETVGEAAGIYWEKGNLTVNLTADTEISCNGASYESDSFGICNAGNGTLTITGTGNLNINSGNATKPGTSSYGIYSLGDIIIGSGVCVVSRAGSGDGASKGVYTAGNLTVNGQLHAVGENITKAGMSASSIGIQAANIQISGETVNAEGSVGIDGITFVSNNAEVISTGQISAFSKIPEAEGFYVALNGEAAMVNDCTKSGTVRISKTGIEDTTTDGTRSVGADSSGRKLLSDLKTPRIVPEQTELKIECGKQSLLGVSTCPENMEFTCSSSDSSVASVVSDGKQITVTGCSSGEAEITLTLEDGEQAIIRVTVSPAIKNVEYITVRNWPGTLEKGDSVELTVDIYPPDAANPTYFVTSSDSTVISCPEGSRTDPLFSISALKEGSAVITVTSADGEKKTEQKINVLPESEYNITGMSGDGMWLGGRFSVTCNGPGEKFDKAVTDLKDVRENDYILYKKDDGSTEVSFSEEFMEDLDVGTHYLELYFNNGKSKAVTIFKIPQKLIPPTGISVDCPDAVEIGKNITAQVKIVPDNAYSKDYEITVTKGRECVNIGEKGESSFSITGLKKGTAVFSVTSPKANVNPDAFFVNVVEESVPVESVTASAGSTTIEVGKETTVRVDITPDNATDQNFSCSTSNTDIIKIGEITGKTFSVTGEKEGPAAIEIVCESDPGKRCTVALNVVSASVLPKTIIVTPESYSLSAGKSIDVGVVITPDEATNKAYRVTVEPDKPDVVYVESGELTGPSFKVTGLNEGKAKITVSSVSDPDVKYSFDISCDVKVEKINTSKNSVFLRTGENEDVSVSVFPSGASNKSIRAYSEDPGIAMLDSSAPDGLRIMGVAPGETDIVLQTKDGSKIEKNIHVSVSVKTASIQLEDANGNPVTTASIKEKYGTTLLVAKLYPDVSSADIFWYSSDPLVAYVLPADGETTNTAVVTGYGRGTAVITAEAGSVKASCTVNVACEEDNYAITYKDNSGTWYSDYPSAFTVKCSSPYSAFYGIQIDGIYLGRFDYSISSEQSANGIALSISGNYMKNLSKGRHTMTLSFNNSAKPVSTYIYVQTSKDSPKTGDSGIMAELILITVSAGFLAAVFEYRRKKSSGQ